MKAIYEIKVNKKFDEAVESLKNNLANNNFGVLWELNFKEKFKEKGLDDFNKNFKILEVCNPMQAKNVLNANIEVGYFLPCKVAVYEKNNSVFVGMINPKEFINMFENNELTKIANDVEKILKDSIDSIN